MTWITFVKIKVVEDCLCYFRLYHKNENKIDVALILINIIYLIILNIQEVLVIEHFALSPMMQTLI